MAIPEGGAVKILDVVEPLKQPLLRLHFAFGMPPHFPSLGNIARVTQIQDCH
jgi:hypothetical protein